MPQMPVAGTCTKQSGHITAGRSGIVGAAGVQINGAVAGTFTLGAQYSVVTLKRKSSNLWTLFGNAT